MFKMLLNALRLTDMKVKVRKTNENSMHAILAILQHIRSQQTPKKPTENK